MRRFLHRYLVVILLACYVMPAYAGFCQSCEPNEPPQPLPPPPPPSNPPPQQPPPQPPAQVVLTYSEINPAQGTIELRFSNGLVTVIDDDLNKAFLSGGNHNAEMDLNAVLLSWANGNVANANAMRAKIHNMVSSAARTTKLVKGAPVQGLMMGMPGGNSFECNYLYVCNIKQVPDVGGGGWGAYSFGFYSGAAAPPYGSDYNYWTHYRDDACEDQHDAGMQMVLGTLGGIASCPFGATGLGAVACFAAAVTVIDGYDKYSAKGAICKSAYPGLNKW